MEVWKVVLEGNLPQAAAGEECPVPDLLQLCMWRQGGRQQQWFTAVSANLWWQDRYQHWVHFLNIHIHIRDSSHSVSCETLHVYTIILQADTIWHYLWVRMRPLMGYIWTVGDQEPRTQLCIGDRVKKTTCTTTNHTTEPISLSDCILVSTLPDTGLVLDIPKQY